MCSVSEQGCVFWGVFLHISCWGEMDFGAQGYIVTDAAPMKPVKEGQGLIVSTSRDRSRYRHHGGGKKSKISCGGEKV